MANKSAILAVKIVSDAKDFQRGTEQAMGNLDKFKSKLSSLTVPALAIGGALLAGGKQALDAASDFQQFSGAVDSVFGSASKQVDAFAASAAKNLGLSGSEYKKFSGLIGSQLKNAGTPVDQLVGKTDDMIKKAADLAAQFGGTVPDAVSAMSSALKGEFDPLESFGISLNQSKIDAEAAALGYQKVNGALTEQAKQAAITSLINKQSADATGANAREAETMAGVQARLTALTEDFSVKIGTLLLPVMAGFVGVLTDVVTWATQNAELIGTVAIVVGVLAAGIGVLNGVMAIMNLIAAANPFVLMAVAIAALVAGIIIAYNNIGWFKDAVNSVGKFAVDTFNNIAGAVENVWNWVQNLFRGFSIPGWLKDVMGFMGMGAIGFTIGGGEPDLSGLGGGMGAIGGGDLGGFFGGSGGTTVNNVTYQVEITGKLLDEAGTAQALQDLLDRNTRRMGGRTAAGRGF